MSFLPSGPFKFVGVFLNANFKSLTKIINDFVAAAADTTSFSVASSN
jgi:hypothetical protein